MIFDFWLMTLTSTIPLLPLSYSLFPIPYSLFPFYLNCGAKIRNICEYTTNSKPMAGDSGKNVFL